jgi:hypothetical protein
VQGGTEYLTKPYPDVNAVLHELLTNTGFALSSMRSFYTLEREKPSKSVKVYGA